jgi:hypothetical protein
VILFDILVFSRIVFGDKELAINSSIPKLNSYSRHCIYIIKHTSKFHNTEKEIWGVIKIETQVFLKRVLEGDMHILRGLADEMDVV